MQDERNLLVFSGNANQPLAASICRELGIRQGKALVSRFSDGEVQVEIEENVRKQEVFVVQPTCAPSAENLVELLVLVDDIVDTAGTLCAAAAALKAQGALKVAAYCTHPVLSGPAVDNINASQLDELVVTDTIPLSAEARACSKIRQLSVAELLAETIRRIAFGESVSSLYVD